MPTDITVADLGPPLLELHGHEVVYGPLYEPMLVRLHSRGVSIQRTGLLRSLFGSETLCFRYAQVASHGNSTLLSSLDEDRLPIEVTGAVSRLIHLLLGILDDARAAPIVASTGSCPTRMGFEVQGVVLGGPGGLLVVPSGLFGLLTGGTVQIAIEQLRGVTRRGSDLVVQTVHPSAQRVFMGGDQLTLQGFARWWARTVCVPSAPGDLPLPVLWEQVEDGVVRTARIVRRPWGIRIRADDRSSETAYSGLRIHVEAESPGGPLAFTAKGHGHRVWFLGGPAHEQALRAHLAAVRFESRRSDYVPTNWKSCSGDWLSARLYEPGVGERLVHSPRVDVTPTDLILRCDASTFGPGLSDLSRRHVQLELANPRRRLAIRCVFRRAELVQAEDPSEPPHLAVSLLPLGPGPEQLPSRRELVRVEPVAPLEAQLEGLPDSRVLRGTLVDLSSGGAQLLLPEEVAPSGHVLYTSFTTADGRKLRVAGEVVHCSKRDAGFGVGICFTNQSERVRTRLQREVLLLQRVERRLRLDNAEVGTAEREVYVPPRDDESTEELW
jgi:hypothetical protein